MSLSDKARILANLLRREFKDGQLEFDDLLAEAVQSALGISRIDAEAFVKTHARKYWNWIAQQVDDDLRAGLKPCFRLLDPGLRRCAWLPWAFSQSTDNKERKLARLLRARPQIQLGIDGLNDREYEALSCVVCELIGTPEVHLTPAGNEGGIDFLATLRLTGLPHIFSGMNGAVRIVGQCKQYKVPVQVDRVEQFIKTIENVRHRAPRVNPHLPAWFHNSSGPIVGWMIAHSGCQVGGRDEAKQHGVILSDSRDLVEVIASAEAFHGTETPAVRAQKMRDRVLEFI